MFIALDNELVAREALKVLTFLREYAGTDNQKPEEEVSPNLISGIGSLRQVAPQRYEVIWNRGGCGPKITIEIKKNCPLEACSYGYVGQKWSY